MMDVLRKIIEIDEGLCTGCGECIPACAEGAIQIIDGKARLSAEKYCDGLGACLGECPSGALKIVERQAVEFDEEAVTEHIQARAANAQKAEAMMACGCPSTQIESFGSTRAQHKHQEPGTDANDASALAHWPVQINLVPPTAPFLKGAHLLVAADCTPVAYPRFHQDFLEGKAVMLGCPKFDDAQAYIQRFAEIFKQADIKGITVVVMEVPCCQGLPVIISKGMELAGKKIHLDQVIISTRGEILERERLVA
jgi:NAD-dependent dihydropyrimidine dehydrogenase PreA subunit